MAPGTYEIRVVRVLSGLINLDLLITFCRSVSHVKRCRLVALLFNNHGCYLKCFECRCEGWFACPNLPPRPSGVPCFAPMLSFVDPSTVRAASSPTARPKRQQSSVDVMLHVLQARLESRTHLGASQLVIEYRLKDRTLPTTTYRLCGTRVRLAFGTTFTAPS